MKKVFVLVLAILFVIGVAAWADQTTETLTFQWDQPNLTNVKEWKIYWGDTSGGPYDTIPVATVAYTGGAGPFEAVGNPVVTGDSATTVKKYFVAVACGDVPQADGSTKYECSADSDEISHDFWIPFGGFEAPVTFKIIAN